MKLNSATAYLLRKLKQLQQRIKKKYAKISIRVKVDASIVLKIMIRNFNIAKMIKA